jgi:hypothetical protein
MHASTRYFAFDLRASVCRLVLALLCLGVGATNPEAHAATTVAALSVCPNTGSYRACLVVPFHLFAGALEPTKDGASLPVAGRLPGRREEDFILTIPRVTAREAPYGAVAYLGRSKRNRPIILTTVGSLELTRGFSRAALPHNLFVLRTGRRLQVVDRYSEVVLPVYIASNGMLWLKTGDTCTSAPQNKPGLLTTDKTACSAHNLLSARASPAADPDFERLLKTLPELSNFRGGQVHDNIIASPNTNNDFVEVLAVNGTPYLIVRIGCDCE